MNHPNTTNEVENITFRIYRAHKEIVERAAAKYELNTSDYVRELVMGHACADTGESLGDLPLRPTTTSVIAQAAAALGISRAELEARAVSEFAAKVVSERSSTIPPRKVGPGSGTYSRVIGVTGVPPKRGSNANGSK